MSIYLFTNVYLFTNDNQNLYIAYILFKANLTLIKNL